MAKIDFSPLILLETSCDDSRVECRAPGAAAKEMGATGTPAARQQYKGEWNVDRRWTLDLDIRNPVSSMVARQPI